MTTKVRVILEIELAEKYAVETETRFEEMREDICHMFTLPKDLVDDIQVIVPATEDEPAAEPEEPAAEPKEPAADEELTLTEEKEEIRSLFDSVCSQNPDISWNAVLDFVGERTGIQFNDAMNDKHRVLHDYLFQLYDEEPAAEPEEPAAEDEDGIPNEIRDNVPAEVQDTPDNFPVDQYRAVFGDDGRFQHHTLPNWEGNLDTDEAAKESWRSVLRRLNSDGSQVAQSYLYNKTNDLIAVFFRAPDPAEPEEPAAEEESQASSVLTDGSQDDGLELFVELQFGDGSPGSLCLLSEKLTPEMYGPGDLHDYIFKTYGDLLSDNRLESFVVHDKRGPIDGKMYDMRNPVTLTNA
eukprot:SAG11_NODE_5026_length_1686_cov_52.124134_2_plen_353_part_00